MACHAEPYPSKPIRLVVPFPPGGAVDAFARIAQTSLSDLLGQPIVIDNRTGASGMVGATFVAKSPPDGYTLLYANIGTIAINAGIYPTMPYDTNRDFAPIIQTVNLNYCLVVNAKTPYKSVPELITYAKQHPEQISYGSGGTGSLPHLAAELFKSQAGIKMIHVPYKGGGPMVTDLIGGNIQVSLADQSSLMPHVKSGLLRALAVATPKRSADYPDLPTLSEAGLPGFETVAWQGLLGPAALDKAILMRLNEAINRVMQIPMVRDKLIAAGLEPVGGTPEHFGGFIKDEIGKWGRISKSVGAAELTK